ncbi:four-helix bundle copper-binding protein [Planosporangium thailandense]|uniref:Four-helix bundle copper-binding protein n=1 Tax=Planosporangium thailandense TaxID=765197 RepID=A0ABX0Y545_9ACTN|nr:four-helix bundle copper-binding protein [Planosporangium thailandense]NJC72459.1 four-helix bundle copper-binding protein [Planosporangium thailandense]
MAVTRQVLDTMTVGIRPEVGSETLAAAIDAMLECEEAVNTCAAAMVTEDDVRELREAIIRDMNCADVVAVTRRVLTRANDTALLVAQLQACVAACEHSAELCGRHAGHHEHCRLCSQATRRCADACGQVLRDLPR